MNTTTLQTVTMSELEQIEGGFFFVALIAGKVIGAVGGAIAYGVAKAID